MATTSSLFTSLQIAPELLTGDKVRPDDPRFGLIWCNPERMSGAPCFYGTRVPVQFLFDYIEAGDTIDDFVEGFPPITRAHVLAVLELAKAGVLEDSAAS
jgi:uncharacterized protein (DUF433 family)